MHTKDAISSSLVFVVSAMKVELKENERTKDAFETRLGQV